jgi:O-antigen/teichoic acid export membrane protein
VLIAALLGREAVGFYSAAYKPVMFAIAALAVFYASFLASYSAAQQRDAEQLFRRSVLLALGLAVPGALAVTIGAGAAVDLIYGDAYGPAAGALAILIWSVPLLAVSGAYASALIAAGRQNRLMTNNVIGAFVNVLLNIAVVPVAGIEGAAAVTLVSEALVLALHVRAISSLELERTPVRLVVAFLQWHVLPTDTRSAER